jgi:membrane protein implicated in regulation of membrane protease activity
MGIVDDVVHSIGRSVRKDARHLLVPILLALAGGLIGAAGMAFLTVWAYLMLSVVVGQASAAFLIGFGLAVLAAVFLVLAGNRFTKKTLTEPPVSQPAAPATAETGLASQIAFTASFVLARSLDEGRRD